MFSAGGGARQDGKNEQITQATKVALERLQEKRWMFLCIQRWMFLCILIEKSASRKDTFPEFSNCIFYSS